MILFTVLRTVLSVLRFVLPQLWYSIDYSTAFFVKAVLYYSHLCKLAYPEWPIQLDKAILKELLYKRDQF